MVGLLTIEVGARGYVAYSTERCFRQLGMQKRTASALCKSLSGVVARCSYAIYLSQNNKDWDKKRELLGEADVLRPPVQRSDHAGKAPDETGCGFVRGECLNICFALTRLFAAKPHAICCPSRTRSIQL